MSKYKEVVLPLAAVALVCLVIASVVKMLPNTGEVFGYVEAQMGVPIIDAYIDSPAVIIYVEGSEFYSLIIELNASVVYKGHMGFNRHYYVFNEPMTIAYSWSISFIDVGIIWRSMK